MSDGTEYSRPLFDIIIFYAGAYSCEGEIDFSGDGLAQLYYRELREDTSIHLLATFLHGGTELFPSCNSH